MEKQYETNLLWRDKVSHLRTRMCVFAGYVLLNIAVISLIFTLPDRNDVDTASKVLSAIAGAISILYFAYFDIKDYLAARKKYYKVPVSAFFTDRRLELTKTLTLIYLQWYNRDCKVPIMIYDNIGQNGKTEFLKKLEFVLKNKKHLKRIYDNLETSSQASLTFYQFKSTMKNIGYVFRCPGDIASEYIENLPKARRNKINILIIDGIDNPENYTVPDYKIIYALPYTIAPDKVNNITSVQLDAFTADHVARYMLLRGRSISDAAARAIVDMTGGSISKLIYNLNDHNLDYDLVAMAEGKGKTPIEVDIDNIERMMDVGNYCGAETKLDELWKCETDTFLNNYKLQYTFLLSKARVLHLLNRYSEAITVVDGIMNSDCVKFDYDNRILMNKIHYMKHIGEFEKAIALASSISGFPGYKLLSLNILSYLDELLKLPHTGTLTSALGYGKITYFANVLQGIIAEMRSATLSGDAYEYYNRYSDIAEYLIGINSAATAGTPITAVVPTAVTTSRALVISTSQASRLTANDRFIAAEIKRVNIHKSSMGVAAKTAELNTLIRDYENIYFQAVHNHDFNLLSQVIAIIVYLNNVYGIVSCITTDAAATKAQCISKEMYFNADIFTGLLEIINNTTNRAYYIELFDNVPFIIL